MTWKPAKGKATREGRKRTVWPMAGDGRERKDEAGVVAAAPAAIARAARRLRAGELVAFPTETVYGLGADGTDEGAVAAVYAAKGRPASNPLIVHVANLDAARELAPFDERAGALAAAFWPGPLTLVLPRAARCAIADRACAGRDTVAVRVPRDRVALALIRAAGRPVVGPSANLSGRPSPTTAWHVRESLGDAVPTILDGGSCAVGIESTVLDMTGDEPLLLRPGGVSVEAVEELVGPVARPRTAGEATPTSPGRAESHYAPNLPVRLGAVRADPDEALLAFGPVVPGDAARTLNLSAAGDVAEAAANLFDMLWRLDTPEFRRIAVMPVPETGVGRAINDRLRRAAAPRPDSRVGGDAS